MLVPQVMRMHNNGVGHRRGIEWSKVTHTRSAATLASSVDLTTNRSKFHARRRGGPVNLETDQLEPRER
jgi:hypothetical protein